MYISNFIWAAPFCFQFLSLSTFSVVYITESMYLCHVFVHPPLCSPQILFFSDKSWLASSTKSALQCLCLFLSPSLSSPTVNTSFFPIPMLFFMVLYACMAAKYTDRCVIIEGKVKYIPPNGSRKVERLSETPVWHYQSQKKTCNKEGGGQTNHPMSHCQLQNMWHLGPYFETHILKLKV